MTKLSENQEYQLKVTWLIKTRSAKFGNKILSVKESDKSHLYYGVTKKEAIKKAKSAGRYNSSYSNEWNIVEA